MSEEVKETALPTDPEEMTDEQLIAAAEAAALKTAEEEELPAPAPEPEPEEQPKPKTTFRREIDLGDGSGKQVFESETQEGLIDALAQAQTHATKKIRELSRGEKVEKAGAKEAADAELTPDEEWLLSQELLNHPSKTQKRLIEGLLGMPIEKFRERMTRMDEMDMVQRAEAATNQFIENHSEDYYACANNKARMIAYLDTYKLEPEVASLEKAFEELSKSGLLEAKPPETSNSAESHEAEQESSRIVKTETKPVTTTRRAGSGLSSHGRAPQPVKTTQLTEKELYEMPLEKLEQLANQQLRSSSS